MQGRSIRWRGLNLASTGINSIVAIISAEAVAEAVGR